MFSFRNRDVPFNKPRVIWRQRAQRGGGAPGNVTHPAKEALLLQKACAKGNITTEALERKTCNLFVKKKTTTKGQGENKIAALMENYFGVKII